MLRGHLVSADRDQEGPVRLPQWEALVVDAVGNVIDFWGFKRNQGRVWALLYLRATPMSAQEIQDQLGLSKGAVSMITRELEQWGVIHRVRPVNNSSWMFVSETDFMGMIGRVVQEREASFVARVKADLAEAERLARSSPDAPPEVVDRIARMRRLAQLIEGAVGAFLKTSQLNLDGVSGILKDSGETLQRGANEIRKRVRSRLLSGPRQNGGPS
ncbi:MAG: hypothetical protein GMKNLPBB_01231 [Myxococcota bacterium]|nr:hypothetical protein [Myxococcota bacterium]